MIEEALIDNSSLALRLVARPAEANAKGDIFGGWLMAHIDLAGSLVSIERARGPVVTVAVNDLRFIKPVYVDDVVSFYCKIMAVGKTSITVAVHVVARRFKRHDQDFQMETVTVANATVTYVAVEGPGKKREVPVV